MSSLDRKAKGCRTSGLRVDAYLNPTVDRVDSSETPNEKPMGGLRQPKRHALRPLDGMLGRNAWLFSPKRVKDHSRMFHIAKLCTI